MTRNRLIRVLLYFIDVFLIRPTFADIRFQDSRTSETTVHADSQRRRSGLRAAER